MSGLIEKISSHSFAITTGAIFILAVVASFTDVFCGKIFNWLTLPMALFGLAFAFPVSGLSGFTNSLIAMGLGLLFYGWMFWFGMMGGGDVKLLMALGAWGGIHYVQEVALIGIALGGVMAVFMLFFQGQLKAFYQKLKRFLVSVMVSEMEVEIVKINRSLTMPFGVPISVAAVWVQFAHPLEHWGIHL